MTEHPSWILSENALFGHLESMWPLQMNSEVCPNFWIVM